MKVTEAIKILSQRRRFHVIVFTLLALNFMFIPVHIFIDLFLVYQPHHHCRYPSGDKKCHWIPYNFATDSYDECHMYVSPLSDLETRSLKRRIEDNRQLHPVSSVWDWRTLKFKPKGAHDSDYLDEDKYFLHRRQSKRSEPRHLNEAWVVEDSSTPASSRTTASLDPQVDISVSVSASSISSSNAIYTSKADSVVNDRHAHYMDDCPNSKLETRSDRDSYHLGEPNKKDRDVSGSDEGDDDVDDEDDDNDDEDDDTDEEDDDTDDEDDDTDDDDVEADEDRRWNMVQESDDNRRHRGRQCVDGMCVTTGLRLDRSTRQGRSDRWQRAIPPNVTVITINGRDATLCRNGIVYDDDEIGGTLATEHGLSCQDDVSVFTNAVMGVAMVTGAVVFAPFADKYGRKTLFMMVWCQNSLISVGIALVGDIRSYWVLRFLSRFYIEGIEIAVLILAVEMLPSRTRPLAPLILYVAYSLGQVLLSLQAMLLRSWWKLQLVVSIETIVLLPFSWFLVPESIHWLVSMRRYRDAEKLIRLGCRLNGIVLPADFRLEPTGSSGRTHQQQQPQQRRRPGLEVSMTGQEEVACDGRADSDGEYATGEGYHGDKPRKSAVERLRHKHLNLKNRPGAGEYLQHEFHAHIGEWRKIMDLMKNHQLRTHFFIVSFMWAIVGFLYYGLTVSTMAMKGNVYLNYCLSGLVMIPASVSIFILRRFGRKKPIFYFLIGAGLATILSVICPYKTPSGVDMYPVYLLVKLVAKYCVVSCLISIRLLIIELFPTPVRGTLIGLTALVGLLGSALGYYFLQMIMLSKWLGFVVGLLTLLAAALSRLLPETSNRPLPDTINDMMTACRDMFVNLLVAMPNGPPPTRVRASSRVSRHSRDQHSGSKRHGHLSSLAPLSSVLNWRLRAKRHHDRTGRPEDQSPTQPARVLRRTLTTSAAPRHVDVVDDETISRLDADSRPALRSSSLTVDSAAQSTAANATPPPATHQPTSSLRRSLSSRLRGVFSLHGSANDQDAATDNTCDSEADAANGHDNAVFVDDEPRPDCVDDGASAAHHLEQAYELPAFSQRPSTSAHHNGEEAAAVAAKQEQVSTASDQVDDSSISEVSHKHTHIQTDIVAHDVDEESASDGGQRCERDEDDKDRRVAAICRYDSNSSIDMDTRV